MECLNTRERAAKRQQCRRVPAFSRRAGGGDAALPRRTFPSSTFARAAFAGASNAIGVCSIERHVSFRLDWVARGMAGFVGAAISISAYRRDRANVQIPLGSDFVVISGKDRDDFLRERRA